MRLVLTITMLTFFAGAGISQNQQRLDSIGKNVQDAYKKNPDSVTSVANAAIKLFTWDIQKEEKGTLMFLDVAYQRSDKDSVEYMTLTVAKGKGDERPAFISIILPNNVSLASGVSIKFATTRTDENGNRSIKPGEEAVQVSFEKPDPEKDYYSARLIDGYTSGEHAGDRVDIFKKFMNSDHVFFLFTYPDGSQKTLGVPLFAFKKQYSELE